MRRRSWVLLVVALLAAAGGLSLWLARWGRGVRAGSRASDDIAMGACAGSTEPPPGRPRAVQQADRAPGPRRPRISEERRERARAFHAAVREARQRSRAIAEGAATPSPAPGAPSAGASAATVPTGTPSEEARGRLDPQYIRQAVRELQPLLAECYEMALAEQADLEGSLVVEFTIEGDPQVGGVVEDTRVADTSTLRHPTLDLCMRETLYTLQLPAPEGSGSVQVRYPFRFSRRNEEGSSAPVGR